ncbi:MAG TPA: saccharopine dehydrogenase family protein [Bacteroidia bacterium]|nr:saccharopine dehydrogenase family protein [Bacteroidia bacterium]
MKNILVLGAGRSSSALITYLLDHAAAGDWKVTVADSSQEFAASRTLSHPSGSAIKFDINDTAQREYEIENASLVISLLPPHLHQLAASDCLKHKIHFLTASYLTPEMAALDADAKKAGILMLNECGLDPGIDHMSAVEIISRLKSEGCRLEAFKSFTGGLVAPESNDNPWGYKISWNPRNVILAGQGTARYIDNGVYKYIPYRRIFRDIEHITVSGYGTFDGYANRDSLAYRHFYGIEEIPTLLRGTLRQAGYCKAWDIFVKLGVTDDSFVIENAERLTYGQMIRAFLPSTHSTGDIISDLAAFCGLEVSDPAIELVKWTGILEDTPTGIPNASPAKILQHLLEKKWALRPGDKDLVIMQHQFTYVRGAQKEELISTLVVKGDNAVHTAMAKTVGLPLAIVAKNVLNGTIKSTGVMIPVQKDIYEVILRELEACGINFTEKVTQL